MTRRIEHHSMSRWPAARIHAALIDADCLRERLGAAGDGIAELVSRTVTEHEARFQLRQRLPEGELPTVIRGVLGGDPLLERSESWRVREDGHFVGEVAATLRRVPSTITGSLWLRDLTPAEHSTPEGASGGERALISEFALRGEVAVHLPFLAERAEELLAGQLDLMIERERGIIADWLRRRG
ncbi:DUF2505 domain-containing protein [Actinopolyspora erythraea]|uniref:DUF2505 domain-containing protein n=1 Tax=Actinopolyspora erythraea TaxID=414996 RepID=A0A099DB47_9ACTN|nr:DUF2505 domain-containing protein [Actinopolyspora erythraea]ASU80340.1 DUF2505 domain-containing protein [Actinopolyspora erythraea]KGI82580.1 hypothetical protein IL38_03860 [Actinopolyspora erythraea]